MSQSKARKERRQRSNARKIFITIAGITIGLVILLYILFRLSS